MRKDDEIPSLKDQLRMSFRSMGLFALKVPKNVWYAFNIIQILFILGFQWLEFGFGAAFLSLFLLFVCFAWFCTFMRDRVH